MLDVDLFLLSHKELLEKFAQLVKKSDGGKEKERELQKTQEEIDRRMSFCPAR